MTKFEQKNIRPSELVLRYIETLRVDTHGETRLPPVREVARHLDVGASTVSVVYRSLANQGRIRTEVGNGSFLLPLQQTQNKQKQDNLRIGVSLEADDLDDPQGWRSRVYGGITIAALRINQQSTLVPIYIGSPDMHKKVQSLDAVVIMPGNLLHQPLVEAARKEGIPVVFFNPPQTNYTRNFVSPDYAGASQKLGQAFLASGRKNILMLLSNPWHLMVSTHFRMSGLLTGLQYGNSNLQFQIEVAHGFQVEDGRRALNSILSSGSNPPDAIYTTGDFLAMGCVEELEAHGISVPQDVSVVGGSGLNLEKYSHPQLTCSAQPYEKIGMELIQMILRLLKNSGEPVPGIVVSMPWQGGATTTAVENTILLTE